MGTYEPSRAVERLIRFSGKAVVIRSSMSGETATLKPDGLAEVLGGLEPELKGATVVETTDGSGFLVTIGEAVALRDVDDLVAIVKGGKDLEEWLTGLKAELE